MIRSNAYSLRLTLMLNCNLDLSPCSWLLMAISFTFIASSNTVGLGRRQLERSRDTVLAFIITFRKSPTAIELRFIPDSFRSISNSSKEADLKVSNSSCTPSSVTLVLIWPVFYPVTFNIILCSSRHIWIHSAIPFSPSSLSPVEVISSLIVEM